MRGLWQKIKASFQSLMVGRHGSDQFSLALLYAAVILNLIAALTGLQLLSLFAPLIFAYAIFRMFSKNNAKRYQENAWFLKTFGSIGTRIKQAYARFKNRKTYVYFDCPECHSKLRLPRGKGDVKVTCGHCGHSFRKQA